MNTNSTMNHISQNRRELTPAELDLVVGGKPHSGQAILDFFAWIGCGFNHHYYPTGKTKTDLDLVFTAHFYQVKCSDCGHTTWIRGELPNIQGPKIHPDAMPKIQ